MLDKIRKVLKVIADVMIFGRTQKWWSTPSGEPTYALDAALSGFNGWDEVVPNRLGRIVRWFDGKKTWTGAALVAVPSIIGALTGFYEEVGLNATTFLKVSGIALAAVGTLHKVVKILDDLTPDTTPGE